MYALIDMQIAYNENVSSVWHWYVQYTFVRTSKHHILSAIVVSNFVASLILNSVHVTEILKQILA